MRDSAPRVSVVVPAFNVAPYIGECIASVQAQSRPDWECIVVDDGSRDGTGEHVRGNTDPRIRLVTQANQGVSTARNTGLAEARGTYVLFLDGDDFLHPKALERLCAELDGRPEAVAAFGTVWVIFEDGRPYPQKPLHRRRYPSGNVLRQLLSGESFLLMGSVLARTRSARRLGGFRVDLRLSEDWEFWCRMAACGEFRFLGTTPEVSYVRVRRSSSSRQLSGRWENHLPTLEAVRANRFLASRFTDAEWRRLADEIVSWHLWEAGRVNFTERHYDEARRLMLRALATKATWKRLALFGLAQASQIAGVGLVPRLRFVDQDARR